jgi:hypothetical protein
LIGQGLRLQITWETLKLWSLSVVTAIRKHLHFMG